MEKPENADTVTALGREWAWPAADKKCREVVFDWSKDLAVVYPHCRAFVCAVQAGGNMGVWPWLLSKKFERVVSCEPDPVCFPFLDYNTQDRTNVTLLNAALSNVPGAVSIKNDDANNLGAQYVVTGGDIPAITIDSLLLDACDLIYLDIEGAEMLALQGAVETIDVYHPVIVVEDKNLSHRFGTNKGDIEKWLFTEFGYRVVARPHRDVVLA